MECPLCGYDIGIIRNFPFITGLLRKKVASCPFCQTDVFLRPNRIWRYFKVILFALLFSGFILLLLALVFGRQIGYEQALAVFFGVWIVAVVIFYSIIFLNLIVIFFNKMYVMAAKEKDE